MCPSFCEIWLAVSPSITAKCTNEINDRCKREDSQCQVLLIFIYRQHEHIMTDNTVATKKSQMYNCAFCGDGRRHSQSNFTETRAHAHVGE